MKLLICALFALSLFGCTAVKMTPGGGHVRYMSELDKPSCKYISNVFPNIWVTWVSIAWDGEFEAVFNDAINKVASAGGDAYAIVTSGETGHIYEMEAWRCGWISDKYALNNRKTSGVQEFSVNNRRQCAFIKSITETSNWGFTESHNSKGARDDAIKHVQEADGNSYFVVNELLNKYGAALIIEAWYCN